MTQAVRSTSWVARSSTTPTSAIRRRKRPLPTGRDLVERAQLAVGQPLPQLLQGRVVALDVTHAGHQARAEVNASAMRRAAVGVGGDRLLDEDVHTGLGERRPRPPRAKWWGRTRPPCRCPAASSSRRCEWNVRCSVARSLRGRRVGDADQLHPGERVCSTRAWWRPIWPKPDEPGSQVSHGSDSSFTAATTRATSSSVQSGADRQREHLTGRAVGLGQVEVQVVRRQPVGRDGVVDGAVDAPRVESGRAARRGRRRARCTGARPARPSGATVGVVTTPASCSSYVAATARRSSFHPAQPTQLDAAHGGREVGHPVVQAGDLVAVALLHALVAQQPHASGRWPRRGRRPCRPRRSSCSWWRRS